MKACALLALVLIGAAATAAQQCPLVQHSWNIQPLGGGGFRILFQPSGAAQLSSVDAHYAVGSDSRNMRMTNAGGGIWQVEENELKLANGGGMVRVWFTYTATMGGGQNVDCDTEVHAWSASGGAAPNGQAPSSTAAPQAPQAPAPLILPNVNVNALQQPFVGSFSNQQIGGLANQAPAANGGGVQCPAIQFQQSVDGALRFAFQVLSGPAPQFVDVHYSLDNWATPERSRNFRMINAGNNMFTHAEPELRLNGGAVMYWFTYCLGPIGIGGANVDCDTPKFSSAQQQAPIMQQPAPLVLPQQQQPAYTQQPLVMPQQQQQPAYNYQQAPAPIQLPFAPQQAPVSFQCPIFVPEHNVAAAGAGFVLTMRTPAGAPQPVWVDAHFTLNGQERNVRMINAGNGVWTHTERELSIRAGDNLAYHFTYCVLINGNSVDCDTGRFAFAVAQQPAPIMQQPAPQQAPYQQPAPIMVQPQQAPYQQPAPIMQQPQVAPQQQYQAPQQYAAPQPQMTPPPPPPAQQCPQCPVLQFSQLVSLMASGQFKISFTPQGPTPAWVDVHFQVDNGLLANVRMINNGGTFEHFETGINALFRDDSTLKFFFTYCVMINGCQVDCDTSLFAFSRPKPQPAPLMQPQPQQQPYSAPQPQQQQPYSAPQPQMQQPSYSAPQPQMQAPPSYSAPAPLSLPQSTPYAPAAPVFGGSYAAQLPGAFGGGFPIIPLNMHGLHGLHGFGGGLGGLGGLGALGGLGGGGIWPHGIEHMLHHAVLIPQAPLGGGALPVPGAGY